VATRLKVIRAQARTSRRLVCSALTTRRSSILTRPSLCVCVITSAEARVFLAKLEKVRLRKNRAAIILQKYARAWLGRRQYKSTVHAAVLFQSSTFFPPRANTPRVGLHHT
jgi:hypothetical protein